MSPFASPYLFRATALDVWDDPWIAPGTHLRVHASPLLGAPVGPFVAWPLSHAHELNINPLDMRWTAEDGTVLPEGPVDVAQWGTVRGATLGIFHEPLPSGWCFLDVEASDDLLVEWLAPAVRPWGLPVLGTRHGRRPYAFGGMGLGHIRVSGLGEVQEVRGLNVSHIPLEGFGDPAILSLPVQGSDWYANWPSSDPFDDARERLFRGQRQRLGPPDSPDGTFPGLGGDEDFIRVFDHLKPDQLDGWLDEAFRGPDAPASVLRSFPSTDPSRRADAYLHAWDVILTMAADPVIARYLGFGAVLEPMHQDEGRPLIWLVAGQFAVSSRVSARLAQAGTFLERVGQEHGDTARISNLLASLFPLGAARERIAGNTRPPDGGQWEFVTLYTLAVAVALAPADPPPAPVVVPARSQWNGGEGLGTWRQTLALPTQPPAGSLGFARLEPGGPVSLHQQLPGYGAAALLANWSRAVPDPASNFATVLTGAAGGPLWTPPMVTDDRLPEDMDPGAWRLWQSDEFGRWSDATDRSAAQPPRPVASAPAPELHFTPQPVPGDAAASPGTITIRIDLPKPEALPPGARSIAGVELEVDGAPQRQPVVPGQQQVIFTAAAAATRPGGSTMVHVTARFRDTDDRLSLDGEAQREVLDPRPIVPPPTAPILVWTGRLDPTGQAELGITWPAPDLTIGYRVYLGDQRSLAEALAIPDEVLTGMALSPPHPLHHTRALAADKICEADPVQGPAEKGLFTLLNETPEKPDRDRIVRFQHRLPGGLRGVQFLRIVPVTLAGTEAPFGTCGLVPVAVPLEDRPPAPAVDVRAEASGVRVRVLAYGLDAAALTRFGYPRSGKAPQFRVRRGRGGVQDSVYIPVIMEGDLEPPPAGAPAGTPWTAEFVEDAAATPVFVRHTYVAEVRFPPEPVQAEALAEPGPLAVRPLSGRFGQDADSRWSPPSLPASTTRVPPDAPAAPAALTAEKQADGTVKLRVSELPAVHPKTKPTYQLAVWKQVAAADGSRLTGEPPVLLALPPGQQSVEHVDATGDAVAFSVALIDPLGRLGATSEVNVTIL